LCLSDEVTFHACGTVNTHNCCVQRSANPHDPIMKFSQAISWVGFFTVQPLDLADSPRELHYTQLPGKQQILLHDPTEHEHDLLKVSVWCALMKNKVISLLCFEEPTMNGDNFLVVMENSFPVRWCMILLLPSCSCLSAPEVS